MNFLTACIDRNEKSVWWFKNTYESYILTHDEIYFLLFDDEMEVSFFSQVTLYSFELGKVQFHSVMVLEL